MPALNQIKMLTKKTNQTFKPMWKYVFIKDYFAQLLY